MGFLKRRHHHYDGTRQKQWLIVSLLAILVIFTGSVVSVALTSQHGASAQEISDFNAQTKVRESQAAAADAAASQAALEATQTHIKFPTDHALNVLFVGDSITYGLYASTLDKRWTALVTAGLSQHGAVNPSYSAAPGRTTADALAKPTPGGQDLTFVLLGNNDIAKLDLATFTANYGQLLARLHSESPDAKLVCVSPFAAASFGQDFVAAEQTACATAGAKFVDIRSITDDPNNRSVVGTPWFEGVTKDTSHPSDQGHKAISEAILKTLVVDP